MHSEFDLEKSAPVVTDKAARTPSLVRQYAPVTGKAAVKALGKQFRDHPIKLRIDPMIAIGSINVIWTPPRKARGIV